MGLSPSRFGRRPSGRLRGRSTGRSTGREVLFEFHSLGGRVKVIAIDGKTGLEVSIFGPANMPPQVLRSTALRKLIYVLHRRGMDTTGFGK